MDNPDRASGGVAGSARRAARRAFWLFVTVAIVCTAQVAWWLVVHVREARIQAELKKTELQAEAYLLDERINRHLGTLWYALDSTVHSTNWNGTVSRTVNEDPAVLGKAAFPPFSKTFTGPFGKVDSRVWAWEFLDVKPPLYVQIDNTWPSTIISRNSTSLRFTGYAPTAGIKPWSAKRRAVEIDPVALDRIEEERQRVFVMFASESAFFVFLIVLGVYLMYRSVRQSADLRRQQRNFVAAVTHELKAPLSSVKLYAETLERPEIGREDQIEFLGRMQQDITRLEHLIDDILMTGRLEQKSSRLNMKSTDFSRDVAEYVQSLKGYLERHTFTLRTNIEPGLMAVTDYDAMRRVVACLVENAVKYSDASTEARLSLRSSDGQIELSIRDSGVGVPADETEKVFQAFYRVGDEMTRKIAGTGLGLYLVREIVASHGGSVTLLSDGPGKGTTVAFRLRQGTQGDKT